MCPAHKGLRRSKHVQVKGYPELHGKSFMALVLLTLASEIHWVAEIVAQKKINGVGGIFA